VPTKEQGYSKTSLEQEKSAKLRHQISQQIYRLAYEAENDPELDLDPVLRGNLLVVAMRDWIGQEVDAEFGGKIDKMSSAQLTDALEYIEVLNWDRIKTSFEQAAVKFAERVHRNKASRNKSAEEQYGASVDEYDAYAAALGRAGADLDDDDDDDLEADRAAREATESPSEFIKGPGSKAKDKDILDATADLFGDDPDLDFGDEE
jgi:hypothetical protein